jgi:hypothetical protein
MECFVIFVFLVFVLVLLLGIGLGGAGGASQRSGAYEQLASDFGGKVHRITWFHPRVTFRYRSANVLVGVFPQGLHPGCRGPITQLQIDWPDARLHTCIATPPRLATLTNDDGLYESRTGNAEFDMRYSIRTSDPAATAGMLTEVVQQWAERLHRCPQSSPLVIEVQRGLFRIAKSADIRRPLDLQDFVRTGLELYDQALLGVSEGIEFLNDQTAQPLEHVVCSVCGEEIAEDLVFCRRCKTPHHRECWVYAGRCSTFGCGEITFQEPRRGRRLFKPGGAEAEAG